jgi:hypothetical protein
MVKSVLVNVNRGVDSNTYEKKIHVEVEWDYNLYFAVVVVERLIKIKLILTLRTY